MKFFWDHRVIRQQSVNASFPPIALIVVATVCYSFAALAQEKTSAAQAPLRVAVKAEKPLILRAGDRAKMPRRRLTVTGEKGGLATYEGVAVTELLRRAGAPLGKSLRGPQLKLYVVADASDGYRAVFALAEFDPDFTDRVIILADSRDGHALAPSEGPFRLIVPGEKRRARWVRQVTALDVEEAK